ncbi:MAG: OB-fold domain-containing protein, partial [Sphingomicrobium sp.]
MTRKAMASASRPQNQMRASCADAPRSAIVDLHGGLAKSGQCRFRHCEERSGAAIQSYGLLRSARNDGWALMIARLTGTLAEASADSAIIDVHGVGYQIQASARTLDALGPIGGDVIILTELQVR